MKCAEEIVPAEEFIPPPGVIFVEIDGPTNTLASSACAERNRLTEIFVRGTEPADYCGRRREYRREEPIVSDEPRERSRPRRRREKGFWEILFGD